MKRPALPLYAKILAVFILNTAVLVLLIGVFLQGQFRLGLDWMLSGVPGDRLAMMGDEITQELSRLPEEDWTAHLILRGQKNGVTMALFDGRGVQVAGPQVTAPAEVLPRLIDRRPPGRGAPLRPNGPISKRPSNAPPKPRFMMRAGTPANYWAGIHLDLVQRQGSSLTLVLVAPTLSGGGLLFDLWPWLALAGLGLVVSALLWLPLVRGITRFIQRLNVAAASIAQGKFDTRVAATRQDELGQLSSSVNSMAAQLGDYVREQRRITADVAHELCSPIARMQLALGIVEQRASPEQTDYLRRLDRELQHMARLVEEVLAFSKAETLPEREVAEEVCLAELVAEVLRREAPDLVVTVDVGSIQLRTLREALDRALGNVVRNAVRHAERVQINATIAGDRIQLIVCDRGPGVAPEALPHLFEPFFRPEAARSRTTGGFGLGLAIAKRCAEACQGSVIARNREGGGLEVCFDLPVAMR